MNDADFAWLSELVRRHTGNLLDDVRRPMAETRLSMFANERRLGGVEALFTWARSSPRDSDRIELVEALLNGETLFFRDARVYQALEERVLPELIERRRATRRLSIWSAACASGQEPYSIAMMLRQSFPELDGWDVALRATDISPRRLALARAGRYSQLEVNRGLPARLLVEYFEQVGMQWEISPRIRQAVEFRPMNLSRPWDVQPGIDLLLLRNVLIYFDDHTRAQLLRQAHAVLSPGGFLVLGGSENVLLFPEGFEAAEAGLGGLYRRR